uniref:Calmodulin-binding protein 60-C n=3 Tax=Rhizophora mucronata TaxID=61149 RepID=A0A2P2M0G5_RHIMU
MVPKRPFRDDGEDGSDSSRPKRFKHIVGEIMGRHLLDELLTRIEPMFRMIVRDEVQKAVPPVLPQPSRSPCYQGETSGTKSFLLHFVNKLPSTIFTRNKIKDEDGEPIQIDLLDANTETRITSGPLASTKIDILVLHGHFGSDDREDWSENEFAAAVIGERDGKASLVTGDRSISLRNGVAQINDLVFTDNSSWVRSRKFRLAARPAAKTAAKFSGDLKIREGISEAFMVKDQRGAAYRKHHPPHLDDDVWRLEKIARDGKYHMRLASYGVHKVRDFLQLYAIEPSRLCSILGNDISKKNWDTIMEHANTCVLDDGQLYAYNEAGQGATLFFNSIYKVVGARFDGQNYEPLEKLTPPQKALVENFKRQAYENVQSFIPIVSPDKLGPSRPLTSLPAEPFQVPDAALQQLEPPITCQDQLEMLPNFGQKPTLRSHDFAGESTSWLEVGIPQSSQPMEAPSPTLRNSFNLGDINFCLQYSGDNIWPSIGLLNSDEDIFHHQTSSWPWGQGNCPEGESGIVSTIPSFVVPTSSIGSPRGRWCKLRAAFKWDSIRKDVAARRMYPRLCA